MCAMALARMDSSIRYFVDRRRTPDTAAKSCRSLFPKFLEVQWCERGDCDTQADGEKRKRSTQGTQSLQVGASCYSKSAPTVTVKIDAAPIFGRCSREGMLALPGTYYLA